MKNKKKIIAAIIAAVLAAVIGILQGAGVPVEPLNVKAAAATIEVALEEAGIDNVIEQETEPAPVSGGLKITGAGSTVNAKVRGN